MLTFGMPEMIQQRPQPDVTLYLDSSGVICQAALSSAIADEGIQEWVGRPWSETIDPLGVEALRGMIEDARARGVSAFLQVNQLFPSGRSLPIEYTAVRPAGQDGLVAIGRGLQAVAELQSRLVEAQQAMERDYWKLREVETRYRLLFKSSTDAVLLLRASNLAILELNPAAALALSLPVQRIASMSGREFPPLLIPAEREGLQQMLRQVAEQGHAPDILLHLGREGLCWIVHASLLSSESGAIFLIQLSPVKTDRLDLGQHGGAPSISELIERMPDGFVVIDRVGLIVRANQGCLDLMQMPTESSVIHEALGRWLGRPGADLTVLLASVQRLGGVRLFSTVLRGELGSETDVELSAAGNLDSNPEFVGVLIRDIGRRLTRQESSSGRGERLGGLNAEIGKQSLRAMVEDAVGFVERHYIEEALAMTAGNRTATAELLGLSRQSLYVKLNRYGLEPDAAKQSTDPA